MACLVLVALLAGLPAGARAVGPSAREVVPPFPPTPPDTPLPDVPDLSGLERLPGLFRMSGWLPSSGWFGIGLQCSDCTASPADSGGATVWRFGSEPEIQYVDPDGPAGKAGLRRGDVLTLIDGVAITSREGWRKFGAVRPGEKVRWTYERDGKTSVATLVAQEHPDQEVYFAPDVSAEMEAAASQLREQHDNLRAEVDRLHREANRPHSDPDWQRTNESYMRQMEAALQALDHTSQTLRRHGGARAPVAWIPTPPEPPAAPSRRQNLRYEGTIAGSEVQVRGSGSVVVSEDRGDQELLITTPDATIRIRKPK